MASPNILSLTASKKKKKGSPIGGSVAASAKTVTSQSGTKYRKKAASPGKKPGLGGRP